MGQIRRAIGLMSGTSMDGIDVALLTSDGQNHVMSIAQAEFAYDNAVRELLRQACNDAQILSQRSARPGCLAKAEQLITDLHIHAVKTFLSQQGMAATDIHVIGFHGHTVLHRPDRGLTVQLGDGGLLAKATGINVVYDLRAADCAAGGQGAPLVPVYHQALAVGVPQRPVAFVNIGGVANITYVDAHSDLIAFDTGPGNALIDDWMQRHSGARYDHNGALAGNGQISQAIVDQLMRHAYFTAPPPKSLDRNNFTNEMMTKIAALSPSDGAATLTAFTAQSIAAASVLLPAEPALWVICGGGRHNKTLMSMIAQQTAGKVVCAQAIGLNGDALEAEAFAYLALRSIDALPLTFPTTTGVAAPLTGGVWCPG